MKAFPSTQNDQNANYLLLHGYGETGAVWEKLKARLDGKKNHTADLMALFNHPDHSPSFEALAKGIINLAPSSSTTIIANSMGGYLALELLRQNPGRFQRLILISTHPFCDTPVKTRQRIREIDLIEKGKANLLGQLFAHPHEEPVKSNLTNMWAQWSDRALANALKAMTNRQSRVETVQQSTIPIHFIIGENDKSVEIKQMESITKASANTTLHLIPGQGHWQLHLWQPPFTKVLMQCLALETT